LAGALRQHNESNAILTLVVVDRADLPNGLRKVAWDTRGRVYEIDGVFRSGEKQGQGGRGIYAGALIGSQTLLDVLPAGREACLKEEGFWPLLRLDHPIHVFATDAYWSDIGTPERYAQTHFEILDGDEALRQSFFPQGVEDRGQGVWAHPSADISSSAQCVGPCLLGANVRVGDGAVVGPYVVMGDNVKVEAGSHVSQTVVWDGVRVVGQKTGMICRLEDETRWSSD